MPTRDNPLSPAPASFRRALLAWYSKSGRHDLPWRDTTSPYQIMVSEFMLQQTTVATVIPYYHRFLKSFPTVEKLASANIERVLELWSGLGYYARARNLHAAAQKIVRDFGGRMPKTREQVTSLPGVGRYTAGAILSFAFNQPEPLVDGNVVRVLTRVYGIREDVKDPKTNERLWAIAWKLIPPSGGRDFNSALMDLGATICRPAGPNCLVCPFFRACKARLQGRQEDIPRIGERAARKEVHLHVGLVRNGARWALVQRPSKGLYGGLWEFPSRPANGGNCQEDLATGLKDDLGILIRLAKSLPSLKHILTHREIHVHPHLFETAGNSKATSAKEALCGWYSSREIRGMAVSSLTKRLLDLATLNGN